MNRRLIAAFALILLAGISLQGIAQKKRRHHREQPAVMAGDTIVRGPFSLSFISNDPTFDTATKRRMISAFFEVYPREVARFNKDALTHIVFFIDTAYDGVAATGDGMARYNPQWMKKHPEDIDVVTHEVMHVVQGYRNYEPGWLTEGIADYVRYAYGVNNNKGDWRLPEYKDGQSYTNAYRVTARFLVWVEKKKYDKIVDDLDSAMRAGTYTPELWQKLTGKTLDELWAEYSGNPAVELEYK